MKPEQPTEVETDLLPRFDRIPWTSWHWKVWAILGGGMFLEGLVLSLGGATLGAIEKILHISGFLAIALTPIFLIGELIGGVLLGNFADLYGRRTLFIVTMLFIIIGSLLAVVAVNYFILAASRFIAGFGIGGELGSAITALGEFSPAANRGFAVGTGNGVMFDAGTFIAGFISYFAISYLPLSIGFRVAFLTALVLAVVIFIARLELPESIRFLIRTGRISEAEALVSHVEQIAIKEGKTLPPPAGTVKVIASKGRIRASEPFSVMFSRYKKRIVLSWLLNFSETWPYYSAFSIFPLIFEHVYGVPPAKVGLLLGIILGVGVAGVLFWAYMLDVIGRRPVLIATYGLSGALFILLGAIAHILSFSGFIGMLSLVYFFTYAAAALLYPQIEEIFPTEARSSGVGTAIGFGRLGGIIAPFALYALEPHGLFYVFAVTGLVLFIGCVAEVVLGPEFKKVSLEKASKV